jgi:DNA-binding NtrC family response regulator
MKKNYILVIDDDRSVRDAFDLALRGQYEVGTAVDGLAGVGAPHARRPDLVFLDLKMPGIDGIETLRRLHAADNTLKVYIVTAFAQEYMVGLQAAKSDGLIFELAAKPLTTAQIRAIVEMTIDEGGDQ